jgi:hypothetical protein
MQENQGIARRRTTRTPHKKDRGLTPPGRKRTLSGRKLFDAVFFSSVTKSMVIQVK